MLVGVIITPPFHFFLNVNHITLVSGYLDYETLTPYCDLGIAQLVLTSSRALSHDSTNPHVLSMPHVLGLSYNLATCQSRRKKNLPLEVVLNASKPTVTSQVPPPLSQRSSDLSDSSDDYIPLMKHTCSSTMTNKLTMISHPIMSRAPIVTNGDITLKIVCKFETHCATFFINAKDGVADNQKVKKILGCFENNLVADWAASEQDHFITLTFEDFMKEFREHWLLENWVHIVRAEMLGTCLNLKIHRFESWVAQIMTHNISLRNTDVFMTNNQLWAQLEIMMDLELQMLAQSQGTSEIKDLHKWMMKIKKINNECQINLKRMAEYFDDSV